MAGIHAIFVGMPLSLNETSTWVGIGASIVTILTFVFFVFERMGMPSPLYETYTWVGITAIATILTFAFLVYYAYTARSRRDRDMERLEQTICESAEAEFSIANRQFGVVPTLDEQPIEKNINRDYAPIHVLIDSTRIRLDILLYHELLS